MQTEEPNDSALQNALDPLFPLGHLKVIGFLIPSEKITDELIQWYETEHSVNASFMWPHMRLYQRNFIMETRSGAPPVYKVVTEFVWKSEEDKRKARALYSTGAAAKTMNEVLPAFIMQPFPANGYFMVPVEERTVRVSPKLSHPDETKARQVILLRRDPAHRQDAFEAAALAYAEKLADIDPAVGIEVNFRRRAEHAPAPADAIIFMDDGSGRALPPTAGDAFDIVNIFGVNTLRSPISAA